MNTYITVIVIILSSCYSPFQPGNAQRYTPLEDYRSWYNVMAECAGASPNWGKQEFYRVDGWGFPCPAYNGYCTGWWTAPHRITVAAERITDSVLISHELLHDLLQQGHNVYSDSVFTKCGV